MLHIIKNYVFTNALLSTTTFIYFNYRQNKFNIEDSDSIDKLLKVIPRVVMNGILAPILVSCKSLDSKELKKNEAKE